MARVLVTASLLCALAALGACTTQEPPQTAPAPQIGTLPQPDPEEIEPPVCPVPLPELLAGPGLRVATLPMDGLGLYSSRDVEAVGCLLADYDIVVTPGLTAPPYAGFYPDTTAYRPTEPATRFFDRMQQLGFRYTIGPEDSGPREENKLNSALTVWPVVFYKPGSVTIAGDRPSGYLEPDRTANPSYDVVPLALTFRTVASGHDFLLVAVELAADKSSAGRRRQELAALASWLKANGRGERDVLVIGALNFNDCGEQNAAVPPGFFSLNDNCLTTDVAGKRMTGGILVAEGGAWQIGSELYVGNLLAEMQPFWLWSKPGKAYVGDPYNPALFDQYFSGQQLVAVRLVPGNGDQD